MIVIEVPNLDAMTAEDLHAFWEKHQNGRKRADLFPTGIRGCRQATVDLANYAINKLTATKCREAGTIDVALNYERICDDIYKALPTWAKW